MRANFRHAAPIVALAAALGLAACAANETQTAGSEPAAGRDCFNVRSVSGFNDVGDETVRVRVGPSRSYDLDLQGAGCRDVRWVERISIEATPDSWICVGDTVPGEIRFRDVGSGAFDSRCLITDVRRVPEPEPAAS